MARKNLQLKKGHCFFFFFPVLLIFQKRIWLFQGMPLEFRYFEAILKRTLEIN